MDHKIVDSAKGKTSEKKGYVKPEFTVVSVANVIKGSSGAVFDGLFSQHG